MINCCFQVLGFSNGLNKMTSMNLIGSILVVQVENATLNSSCSNIYVMSYSSLSEKK